MKTARLGLYDHSAIGRTTNHGILAIGVRKPIARTESPPHFDAFACSVHYDQNKNRGSLRHDQAFRCEYYASETTLLKLDLHLSEVDDS